MKGKRSTYIGCVCLIMVIAGLTGCISGEVKTDDRGSYDQERSSNDQERSSNTSDPAGDFDHSNIADWMDITSESDKEFYIIMNLAIGGNLGGPMSHVNALGNEANFIIDYVRVYQ